ncbi:hypothetical protein H0H81_005549 [Sphagnurus paluster]|uniref:Proteasome activator complex subunit 4 C-terminal domain-containing protein n=1 Tax=Sphagnurus paluster TaxID=117069 RepID=A0A9P7KJR0_9AGAR|nr:hypothetical protein H0H81_005549 [Sphagnurus paluster]
MKRELVKSLRTVTLLAMFSQDATTVSNIQSCLKSMSVMEPDLILHPILERAVPSLEALVETQRTIAVIKALGAVAPAIVSRDVYYPGAKHLVPILQLLIPGIDLLCTTAFLVEISQFIKFGDLTMNEDSRPGLPDAEPILPQNSTATLPSFSLDEIDGRYNELEPRLTDEEEDALLKDSTGSFPDWIANFIRRVIQLLENLPDEGPDGSAGGATEVQVVDAVTGACSQICVHLSEPLYDLVLNMIFDYASTNVRPNAVRAIHQLVECVANADPVKTLAKFFHFCARNIRVELDNGASSLRTTSVDISRDEVWRNDFCRHLSFVRNAFSGIPTLIKEIITPEELKAATLTSDILNEIPEMIASIEPVASGFCLPDPADARYQYMASLKERFGNFLHDASVSLQQQGAENTVDAVDMLIRAMRTFMLEYGDNRDSYNLNDEQYRNEKNVARQFAHQKVWPRAVYVRRARYYHSARLHWNSIERRRGTLEDALIDDVVEWSLWHYAGIRRLSQSLLESICEVYDGVRRRVLPVLLEALEPGTEDDRMKGALWTMNSPYLGKYAISEPTLAPQIVKSLLGCQHNEKPSIQDCVSVVAENCMASFLEPLFLVYEMQVPHVDKAVAQIKATLNIGNGSKDGALVVRCRDQRVARSEKTENSIQTSIDIILEVGESEGTHWRYEIVATRCLRTLVRRDAATSAEHTQFFLDRVHDDHPTIRYYAQRAATKIARNIKLRTFCMTPADLALMQIRNPLKMKVVVKPSQKLTSKVLSAYRKPFDITQEPRVPFFLDREPPGWVAWDNSVALYLPPHPTQSAFQTWDPSSENAIEAFRESAVDPTYWEQVASHYSEENHETVIAQDNVSFVKSIFQLLEDEPFESLRPIMEKMIKDKDQNKQRAAAELVAGVISGSKHWPTTKQQNLWKWFNPFIKQIFGQNIKTDTLMIWSSFFEYIFYRTDPRRVQPLVDYIVNEFKNIDFNAEMTFDGVKVLSLFRAFYEELGRKFTAWADDALARSWSEITSEHDDLRAYIGELLAFTEKIKWMPRPSLPTTEVFIKECRVLPVDFDIMGMRGVYHKDRVLELVERFKVWREERLPGVRAFQSTYDRVGVTVCKWLYQAVHDVHAISTFDYILPLMVGTFYYDFVRD